MASNGSRRALNPACVLIVFMGCSSTVWSAQYSGGTGTADDPYRIATAADLIALGETPEDFDKHFILTADIDLDPNLPGGRVFDKAVITPATGESNWLPSASFFTGVLDGNGHTISNLTIRGTCFLGLFGAVGPGARVFRLDLEATEISGTGSCLGGLAGENHGSITACYSTGSVTGHFSVGGFAGFNRGRISASYATGVVDGDS